MWIWILEIVILLIFAAFGGLEGFIVWATLSALILFARYVHGQNQLKAAEVMVRAEREQLAERERRAKRERRAEKARANELQSAACAELPASASKPDDTCERCGTQNDSDAVFCKRCGAAIVRSLTCTCGQANHCDADFCKRCGTSLRGRGEASGASGVPFE